MVPGLAKKEGLPGKAALAQDTTGTSGDGDWGLAAPNQHLIGVSVPVLIRICRFKLCGIASTGMSAIGP